MKTIIPVLLVSCSVGFCVTDAEMDVLHKEAIANAKTERERTLAIYEQRIAEFARKKTDISEIFRPEDGVDQFEALLLAKVYFMQNFGFCGDVGLPEKKEDAWIVAMFVGFPGEPTSPAIIDARTGRLRCDGHPDVTDAAAYMREAQTHNKRPEGTEGKCPPSKPTQPPSVPHP